MPSQLSLWIVFPQNSMVTFSLNFFLCVTCWDIFDNYKVWIESMMVMFGVSCKLVTSKIWLIGLQNDQMPWTFVLSEWFFVLYFNILLHAMKLVGVPIDLATNIWVLFHEIPDLYHQL